MPAPTTTGCRWGHTMPQKRSPRLPMSTSLPCPATPRPRSPAIWAACTRSPRVPSYRRIRRTSPIIRPHNQYTTQYYDTNFTNERDGKLLISLDNVEPVSWYLVFMGGDEKITHVKTDVTNKRTLVIVKDSYGNALVPYLTQSFSDIYVIDMRYFDLNAVSFMQQVGATDVLFAMNTFSATGGNSECLETIRTQ